MEISFCSHPSTNKVIATKFGTWYDSWAVVACAKFCCDMINCNWIRAKWIFHRIWIVMEKSLVKWVPGFKISNWIHLSVGQVDCKNHLSECTIHLSEMYKANATYVKIRNMQSSVGQVLHVFHLSDCHFYSSQTIRRVKFQTLWLCKLGRHQLR